MIKAHFLFCLLLFCGCSQSQPSEQKVGFTKEGFEHQGGALIGLDRPYYGIESFSKPGSVRLLLQIDISKNQQGTPKWTILDRLDIQVATDELVVFGEGNAFLNEKMDPEIICLAKMSEAEFFSIVKAWRANRKTKQFESISTKGLTCRNEGYGV